MMISDTTVMAVAVLEHSCDACGGAGFVKVAPPTDDQFAQLLPCYECKAPPGGKGVDSMHHTPARVRGRAAVEGLGGYFWETRNGAVWFVPDDVARAINIEAHEVQENPPSAEDAFAAAPRALRPLPPSPQATGFL